MREPIDSQLLARYFAGIATDDEQSLLERRMADDPNVEQIVSGLRQAWNAAGKSAAGTPPADWDTEAAWEQIQARIQATKSGTPPQQPERSPRARRIQRAAEDRSAERRHAPRPFRRSRTSIIGVALLVLMAIGGISFLIFSGTVPSVEQTDNMVFAAARGQQSVVTLSDGTSVRLNSDSRLTVPKSFETSSREVRLEGEAYFEVAAAEAPFVVRGEHIVVKVVGTEFVMSSYRGETSRVAVAGGTVNVADTRRPPYETAQITAGELAILESDEVRVRRDPDAVARELAWIEQRLVFEATPFGQVVRELERWYDLEIDTSAVTGDHVGWLSATLSDEPLDEVLHVVTTPLGLRFEASGDTVRVFRSGSNDR